MADLSRQLMVMHLKIIKGCWDSLFAALSNLEMLYGYC